MTRAQGEGRPSPFRCPICKGTLTQIDRTLRCARGHSFDFAAQGYVHLLPSDRMRTKLPGDNREMVEARRRFLDAGYYAPFRDAAASLLVRALAPLDAPVVLDAGCGEGYYTDGVRRALAAAGKTPVVIGVDISKPAVKAACARSRELSLAVASCFALPVADGSADALLAIFSPIAEEEFARVVRPGGYLLLAVAGERHLFGLKEVLYDHPYENEHRKTDYRGFSFVSRTPVRTTAHLTGRQQIADLFAMTPYYWKTPAAGAARLAQLETLDTELGFDLLLYRREETT
jgi:23S rRNA (guanine745-N1)-methyltransferase